MAGSSDKPPAPTSRCCVVAAVGDMSSRTGCPPVRAVGSPVGSGPAARRRFGPDTEPQPNARCADQQRVDGLIRTRYMLEVCVVCGHERVHTLRQESSCAAWGGAAWRSFVLFRELREVER